MQQDQNPDHSVRTDSEEPVYTDLERYTSYEDDGSTVIYDRENATAWIQSDVAQAVPR